MTFEKLIEKLKEKGFDIIKQPNTNVYQINGFVNLDGITISESPVDIHIGLWQNDNNIQTGLKTPKAVYDFINNLNW